MRCQKCNRKIPETGIFLEFKGTADVVSQESTTLKGFRTVGVAWEAHDSYDEEVKCPYCEEYSPITSKIITPIEKLIEKLEIRKRQLIDDSTYPLHDGHHLRDIMTVLAVLQNDPLAEKLLENMPNEEDVKP
jgi:phage FluMu protein Com